MLIMTINGRAMIVFPQTTEYALRAALHLAAQHPHSVSGATLAAAVGAPANSLSKTLNQLVRARVLASTRGPAGGFRLVNAPEDVTLDEIVRVFSKHEPPRCLLGLGPCGSNPTCAVHAQWAPIGASADAFLRSTTLATGQSSFSNRTTRSL
jgi:Rrf2 family protein